MKPFLTLSTKDFRTGISPSAHAQGAGLFFKADGITPIVEPGVDQSANNGLLMCGGAPTTISGTLTGNIIGSAIDTNGTARAYYATDDGKLWSLQLDTTFGTAISSIRTVSGLVSGVSVFAGNLFYALNSDIGKYDLASSYDDTWATVTKSATIGGDYIRPMHSFGNYLFFGDGLGAVGRISSALAITAPALSFYSKENCTDISDDGTYVILATTGNTVADITNPFKGCRILFWDGFNTTSWVREYEINDPFIYALEKTPFGVFAIGVTGIWQVSIGGIKKVFTRSTGIYNVAHASAILYGRAAVSYYVNALLLGGTSGSNKAIKAFGSLDSSMKNAVINPFLSTASKNITYVDGQALKGYVLVGDSTPQLKAYPFSGSGTLQTGNTAQTIYFDLPAPIDITAISITFGEPLASGDTLDLDVFKDEDTAAVDWGNVSYDATKTQRRHVFRPAAGGHMLAEDQLSLLLTFTAGAVKIKKIEAFGIPHDRANP